MTTNFTTVVTLLTAGVLLAGSVLAQTPAEKPATKAPAKASATPATPKAPAAKSAATPLALKTQKEKGSYAIGISIGKSLQRDGVAVDPAIILRGMKDALAGGKLLLTDEETKAALTQLQQEARAKQEAEAKVAGTTNQKEGEAFLAANKSKP